MCETCPGAANHSTTPKAATKSTQHGAMGIHNIRASLNRTCDNELCVIANNTESEQWHRGSQLHMFAFGCHLLAMVRARGGVKKGGHNTRSNKREGVSSEPQTDVWKTSTIQKDTA
jgi:hypothetical protein